MKNSEPTYRELKNKITELEKQVGFYKSIAYKSNDWETFRNESGKIMFLNKGFEQITGFNPDDLVSGTLTEKDVVHPDDWIYVEQSIKQSIEQIPVKDLVFRIIRKDKQIRHISLYSIPVYANGEFLGIRTSARDITKQKNFIELMKSREKFKKYIQSSPTAVFLVNDTGKYIYVNPAACKLLGYTEKELLQLSIPEIVPSDKVEAGYQNFLELKQNGKTKSFETQLKRKDGNTVEVVLDNVKISDTEYIAFVKDISQLKEKEQKLKKQVEEYETLNEEYLSTIDELQNTKKQVQENELKFRQMYEYSSIGIASATLDFKIISANQAFCNMLGYTEDELIGKTLQDYTHPEIVEHNIVMLKELMNGNIPHFQLEKQFIHKDGHTVHGLLNATIIKDTNDQPLYFLGNVQDISDRKKAETELIKEKERAQESERKFKNQFNFTKALTRYLPIPLFFKDSDARYLGCNPAFENFTGKQEKDIIGKTVYDLWQTDAVNSYHEKNIELINDENEFQSYEKIITDAENRKRTVNSYHAVYFNENNQPAGIVGVLIDITERKNTELLLRQNADRLKILYDLNQLSHTETSEIYDFALEKSLELCNSKIGFLGFLNEQETIVKIHAWSASAMKMCEVKDKYIDFVVEETGIWGEVVRQRKPLIINDFKAANPLKRGTPEGHVKIENYLSIPIFDKDKIFAIIAVGNKETDYNQTDVQELTLLMEGVSNIVRQRRYEQEISEIAERFKALHNASFGGIVIHDKGLIIECNQGLSEITGYTYDELIGMDGLLLISPDTRDKVLNNILAGYEKTYEATGIRKNGEIYPLRLEARNIPYKGKRVRTVEFRDITESKQAEKDLIAAKEKAEESNRLKTAFLQNISHEIRTPLNAISGFSGMLSKPKLTDEKRNSFVSIIQTSSNQLLSIVTDILTISSLETKQEKVNIDKVCVNNIIVDLLAIFKQQSVNQNISLYAKQPLNDKQSEIYTDKTKITQILSNLISNAMKFTHEGFIEFGYEFDLSASERPDSVLQFYVKDSGVGIQADQQEKIFERFRQADLSINKKYGGTGLGLSISKGFAELLGGKIWVNSEIDKGSTFYFTIPYKPVNEIENNLETQKQTNSKPIILVAEDEEFNFLYIEELLIDYDYNLIHAKDGQETVDIFKSNPDISLILMDIKMPIMDGHTAAKIIKEQKPNMQIIAQSAYALEHEIEKYSGIFDDYLTKPIKEELLIEKITKYMNNK